NVKLLSISIICFVSFCLASSFVYILNDIIDVDKDKIHPIKKYRIIPSGKLNFKLILLILFSLLLTSLVLSFMINLKTFIVIILYIIINIFYSIFLKHIVILDVMVIALGFVLRVLAGTFSIDVEASNWILLTTLSVSLFLGFGKRRNEIIVMGNKEYIHRPVLEHYNLKLLEYMIIVSVALAIITYILYTIDAETISKFNTNKLYYSVPLVIFGLFRYMYILFKKDSGGDPADIVSKDKFIIFTVIIWLILMILLIYKII
ncbi:MAG TPA: decaprenyl-phosphate phosphoribosyltransferase, partial [Spirochaetota bacterium]|nr:decaprenyl-phosphate phosphoribosyltransferase [Spirochaetota bacterium]